MAEIDPRVAALEAAGFEEAARLLAALTPVLPSPDPASPVEREPVSSTKGLEADDQAFLDQIQEKLGRPSGWTSIPITGEF